MADKEEKEKALIGRDTSWLDFNHRVLQEAADPRVPLYERLKFLAIYSSNLDEFFRVRVASLRSFRKLKKKERHEFFDFKPKKELREIRSLVHEQQEAFGRLFRNDILPALAAERISLLQPEQLSEEQRSLVGRYFHEQVAHRLQKRRLEPHGEAPFLENRQLYLLVDAADSHEHYWLINIPSRELPRFVALPPDEQGHFCVIFLDDVLRLNLADWLEEEIRGAYSVKLSRDAELYIDDEYAGDLLGKLRSALQERKTGLPTRFLYDAGMPDRLLRFLKQAFQLSKDDLNPGARYHNFHDFFHFPLPPGREDLRYEELPPLPHPALEGAASLLELLEQGDQLLHFPYQRYDYIPELILEAAENPAVESIKITLYRVADQSSVVQALLRARERGKQVSVFIEAKARFDEEANLYWGGELERAGARVQYSYPGIKVHTKLLLITARRDEKRFHYTYIGTGNFNEKTALLYADHALLTTDQRLGKDSAQVFELLEGKLLVPNCRHLLVAPYTLREELLRLIDAEIEHAQAGQPAYLFLKLNSLEEEGMIARLREAAAAGVEVRLIVRGICRLAPAPEEGITIISIVDRFLEHARVYIFGNGGEEKIYIASADWMDRNLFRRVEVAAPIYDEALRRELRHLMDLQWRDNQKARYIRDRRDNAYANDHLSHEERYRAQTDIYNYLASQVNADARSK